MQRTDTIQNASVFEALKNNVDLYIMPPAKMDV